MLHLIPDWTLVVVGHSPGKLVASQASTKHTLMPFSDVRVTCLELKRIYSDIKQRIYSDINNCDELTEMCCNY